jgi:hypothetical protein
VVAGLGEWELSSSKCDVGIHRSFCLLRVVNRYLRGLRGVGMVVTCSLFVGCGGWDAKGKEGKGLKEERRRGGKVVWLEGLRGWG